MRPHARIMLMPLLLTVALGACGDKDKKDSTIQMKDMEVVDGTATDAMTDLDGVQGEGTAAAMPGANASNAVAAPAAANASTPTAKAPASDDAEVLSDQ